MSNVFIKASHWLGRFRPYRFAAYEFAFFIEFLEESYQCVRSEWWCYRDYVAALKERDAGAFKKNGDKHDNY